jgi:hypothetical protein
MAAADAPVGASATLRSHLGVDLLVATATGVFSMAAAAVVFGIRPGDVGRFWGAGGDMTPVIGVVKGAVEGHDLTINRDLGYPGFMDSAQFPLLTDGLHWLQVLLLGRVTGDAVLAVNTYALL